MIVGNSTAGGAREVGIFDNLTDWSNLKVNGRVNIGTYVNGATNVQDVSCNSGDYVIGGGAACSGVGTLLDSYPKYAVGAWHASCYNPPVTNPTVIYAICMAHGS
jgi:hypothetical protein